MYGLICYFHNIVTHININFITKNISIIDSQVIGERNTIDWTKTNAIAREVASNKSCT